MFFRKKKEIEQLHEECDQLHQQLEALQLRYQEDCQHVISQETKRLLYTNLDHKNIYLIDYENITMVPSFVLEDANGVCYIFHNQTQKERLHEDERLHDFQGLHYDISTTHTAKNALDTLLSFYLGQIYSAYHPQSIFVISNDSDYENLKRLSMHFPHIPYEQITLNDIKRRQKNTYSDDFYKRFLLDYIRTFDATHVQRHIFVYRLRGSKVHGMDTSAIQYALHRMKELQLIEEYTKTGRHYVHLLKDNILKLSNSMMKVEQAYVY